MGIRRQSVRILVYSSEGRFLLLHTCDPFRQESRWLELPGGGVEPGESVEQAAKRELQEEAGISVKDVGAPFAVVDTEYEFAGRDFSQTETVFGIKTRSQRLGPVCLDGPLEEAAHLGSVWWTRDQIGRSDANLYPPELIELLDRWIILNYETKD